MDNIYRKKEFYLGIILIAFASSLMIAKHFIFTTPPLWATILQFCSCLGAIACFMFNFRKTSKTQAE